MAIQEYMQSEYYRKRKAHGSEYLFMRKQFQNNECLKPVDKSTIENMTRRIGKNAGVKNCHPHRFRRTFATGLANRGMEIQEIGKLLGHASLNTTLTYVYTSDADLHNSYRKYIN
jgi:integrase